MSWYDASYRKLFLGVLKDADDRVNRSLSGRLSQ